MDMRKTNKGQDFGNPPAQNPGPWGPSLALSSGEPLKQGDGLRHLLASPERSRSLRELRLVMGQCGFRGAPGTASCYHRQGSRCLPKVKMRIPREDHGNSQHRVDRCPQKPALCLHSTQEAQARLSGSLSSRCVMDPGR